MAQSVPIVKPAPSAQLSIRHIFRTWWPLALSWVLMNSAMPILSAFVARLPNPEISLAAYGGVISPIVSLFTAPTIMLLSTSNALVRDFASYQKIRRYMNILIIAMTALHALLAFTPAYYWLVRGIIHVPEEIVEPGRIGLIMQLPWAWAIGYRRFHQGLMIRFGHAQEVWYGTAIRLLTMVLVLSVGFKIGTISGIMLAVHSQTAAVVAEAIYAGWRARPLIRGEIRYARSDENITLKFFLAFYTPLVLVGLMNNIWGMVGSMALSRLPNALISLAVWPVITGLVYPLSSTGMAFNEVVVALIDRKGSYLPLQKFSRYLTWGGVVLFVLIAVTPLGYWWFRNVSALSHELAVVSQHALWFFLPYPAIKVISSWYQGALMHGRKTRGITESVFAALLFYALFLMAAVAFGNFTGVLVTAAGMTLANIIQSYWMYFRARPIHRNILIRDGLLPAPEEDAAA